MKKTVAFLLAALTVLSCFCTGCASEIAETKEAQTKNEEVKTEAESETETESETQAEPKTEEEKTLNILFLGNSLIYYNDMPQIFRSLATAGGKKVVVDSVTKGSATMSDFASPDTTVGKQMRKKLSARNWDYIVIEPSRRITPFETTVMDAESAAAKTLQNMATQIGAEIILYAVWGNNTGSAEVLTAKTPTNMVKEGARNITRSAHTNFMHSATQTISQELGGVTVVEAGYAFENLIADPNGANINLYHTDNRHPSPAGSYLVAAAFYATIFGEPASSVSSYTNDLSASTANVLRSVADKTVLEKTVPVLDSVPTA